MKWTDGALASISMGYQIGVTPLQMVAAVSAVANGGMLIEPRLVHSIERESGRVFVKPRAIRRSIKTETASRLTAIMEQVVQRGTGRAARIPGYRIAGKSGTAAKVVDKRYSKTDYNVSFVGFLPARNPVFTILVVIDTPRGDADTGGAVAGPVFRRVAEAALRHAAVAPAVGPDRSLVVTRERQPEVPRPRPAGFQRASTPVTIVAARPGVMPDLAGLGVRDALRELARLGLDARLVGQGVVVGQEPAAGMLIGDVDGSILQLGRHSASALSGAQ
jgi:cell division protein FtsI (penicillin-binding protein 3)/stage V sporulation protein D (sporulation-specific penicillin-binding protein)